MRLVCVQVYTLAMGQAGAAALESVLMNGLLDVGTSRVLTMYVGTTRMCKGAFMRHTRM